MPNDPDMMQLVIRLAAAGHGRVEPNPMVGCIIVKDGQVIGLGHHQKFGGPHAEPLALDSCSVSPAGATAYVNLEPCCHLENKKTPPCVPRLIAVKLARVVVGCLDPNPAVSGRGLTQLREAGIEVKEGVLADQAMQLNSAYFKRVKNNRPYITLKWAQTADGKIAGPGGRPLTISTAASRQIVHRLRGRCDAILVGIGTVLADDPLLTVREATPQRPCLRIVLDSKLRIPPNSRICQSVSEGPVMICCSPATLEKKTKAVAALREKGIEIFPLTAENDGELSLAELLDELGRRGMTHVLVEPGPNLAAGFLRRNLADRAWIFRSPMTVEDATAPSAPQIDWPPTATLDVDEDQLTEYLNPQGHAFFANSPSADIVLAET